MHKNGGVVFVCKYVSLFLLIVLLKGNVAVYKVLNIEKRHNYAS